MLLLFNPFEVLTQFADRAESFARKLSFRSTFDSQGVPSSDFLRST